MKTIMALLLVLALALVSAPLAAEAKRKKAAAAGESAAADSFCGTFCEGKRGAAFVLCKDECELQQRANLVSYGRIDCRGKCTEQKGITKEAMIVCQENCEKDYKVKAAEQTAACNKTCAREKSKMDQENCKIKCTPPPA